MVVYFDDGTASGQRTVVTETRGDLRGRRVVRGREVECREFYEGLNHRGTENTERKEGSEVARVG